MTKKTCLSKMQILDYILQHEFLTKKNSNRGRFFWKLTIVFSNQKKWVFKSKLKKCQIGLQNMCSKCVLFSIPGHFDQHQSCKAPFYFLKRGVKTAKLHLFWFSPQNLAERIQSSWICKLSGTCRVSTGSWKNYHRTQPLQVWSQKCGLLGQKCRPLVPCIPFNQPPKFNLTLGADPFSFQF